MGRAYLDPRPLSPHEQQQQARGLVESVRGDHASVKGLRARLTGQVEVQRGVSRVCAGANRMRVCPAQIMVHVGDYMRFWRRGGGRAAMVGIKLIEQTIHSLQSEKRQLQY